MLAHICPLISCYFVSLFATGYLLFKLNKLCFQILVPFVHCCISRYFSYMTKYLTLNFCPDLFIKLSSLGWGIKKYNNFLFNETAGKIDNMGCAAFSQHSIVIVYISVNVKSTKIKERKQKMNFYFGIWSRPSWNKIFDFGLLLWFRLAL